MTAHHRLNLQRWHNRDSQSGAKWKRLFNAVAASQNNFKDGRSLIRLVMEVMKPVRFGSP